MMTFEDVITLLNDAENTFLRRRATTTDPAEREALTRSIDDVRRMRDRVGLGALLDIAATLNRLAGVIEDATAALRSRPFDAVLGAYQSLFDRIGGAVGNSMRQPPVAAGPAAARSAADPAKALAEMFAGCVIRPERVSEIDRFYVRPMTAGRAVYQSVGQQLGMPWWAVGAIHSLEGSFSFETHLHNGDPLTARTVHHPAGRPGGGQPPFTWMESAIDALTGEGLANLGDWSLGTALDRLERYNGVGYRNLGVASPYLWSFSNHYEKGKFASDHSYDPNLVSKQCGVAVLMKRLVEKGLIDLDRPLDAAAGSVATLRAEAAPDAASTGSFDGAPAFMRTTLKHELSFPGNIAPGQKDTGKQLKVRRVQEWCTLHGHQTMLDGDFGGGTAASVRAFQSSRGFEPTGIVDERCWAALTQPMHRALAAVSVDHGDTIYDTVLRVAHQHLALHPIELVVKGKGNCGPWVRLYMLGNEGTDQPWCAGFVSHVIGQAAFAMGMSAPIPRQVGVDALVADAKEAGRFIAGDSLTSPQRPARLPPGCLFVVRKSASDWTHVGFVVEAGTEHFKTIEGNTNDEGSREGFEVCARARGYGNRDFILLV